MIQNPLISIAMATYNGENFLQEQLDSIFNQTYKNIEVVVTDDCSSDKTIKILQEYSQRFPLRYFVNKERLGFKKNFEKAISLCKGDYIALSDQDDIWLAAKLEILAKEIGGHSLICTDVSMIDKNGSVIVDSFFKFYGLSLDDPSKYKMLLNYKNFASGCALMFKSELIGKALPIPQSEDFHDWWLAKVAASEHGIRYLDESLTFHRRHDSNVTDFNNKKSILTRIARFFSRINRDRFKKERLQFKIFLENTLSAGLLMSEGEKAAMKECIYYLECFISERFNSRAYWYGYKNRERIFDRKIFFWSEMSISMLNIIENILFGSKKDN